MVFTSSNCLNIQNCSRLQFRAGLTPLLFAISVFEGFWFLCIVFKTSSVHYMLPSTHINLAVTKLFISKPLINGDFIIDL